jgi:hypothetical protein
MEELPTKDLELCRRRINQAGLKYILKTADKDTKVSAKAWGMTYNELEGLGAEFETKATLTE